MMTMTTTKALSFTSAVSTTKVSTTKVTTTTHRPRGRNVEIVAIGGFGPNIDAAEIRKRQAEKQKKIEAAKAAAGAKKSGGFGARKAAQQTIAGSSRRVGRTMPGGGKVGGTVSGSGAAKKTVSSKTKTVSGGNKAAQPEKKKLFGLF